MLGGRISNQDEEEVEDELAALEAEVSGQQILPAVPDTELPVREAEEEAEPQAARTKQQPALLAA